MDIRRIIRRALEEAVSSSTPSVGNVNSAIDNHERVIISYDGEGKDKFKGPRMVDIYAYGLTRAGNPVIRAFQQYPHQNRTVKGWKFFRLDRITSWKNTGQTFYKPESFSPYGDFNRNGDKTMSIVYNIAKFDGESSDPSASVRPVAKFKTRSETGLERLRNAVENPIYLKDLKKDDGFEGDDKKPSSSGPKTSGSKPYNRMNQKERDQYRAWKEFDKRKTYNPDDFFTKSDDGGNVDRLSDKYFSDYEKALKRSQDERDRRALGITGGITPEKLSNALGSVDKMKKYHKGSANDYLNHISKEELDKAIEKLKKEEGNG